MQNNNMNAVVFDQNQSFMTEQSNINYNTYRRATTNDIYTSNHQQPQSIINNQINSLTQKLNNLQQKAERIQQYIKSTNINNSSQLTINTNVNTNNTSTNSAQIEELLRVVEMKIQIVVQQTKKIIQKMTGQFDKKLAKASSQKNHQLNSVTKIQTHCRDTITKIQQGYQEQLNMIRNQHVHLQKRLIQKVQQIENQYKQKLKEFKNKEQQYMNTIQQLQGKLRMSTSNLSNLTNKSKKMIEVTQDKPPSSSMRSQFNDNTSNMSSQKIGSLANPNDTSRKRTKIFQGRSSNKSISPNNQVLSPLKSQSNIRSQTQVQNNSYNTKPKIPQPNKNPKPSETTNNLANPIYPSSQPIQPMNNNFISSAKNAYHNIQVKATVVPSQNSSKSYAQSLPRSFTQKALRSEQQNIKTQPVRVQPPKQAPKQQVKQVPKFQWQRFQDFNDEEDSGESEDVFFYPQHNSNNNKQVQQPKSVFDYQYNNSSNNFEESMHSPFDLK